ncbi:hypothetical protein F4677DRAFT_426460 [Hypoxylon crocopeplum]|nr:hypothetical protein F4677DRAFT_426460 [Hypoxylon crocopeplum]
MLCNAVKGPLNFIVSCLPCFPRTQSRPPSPARHNSRYNAQVRSNLNLPPQLQLPRVEHDPSGLVSVQPQRIETPPPRESSSQTRYSMMRSQRPQNSAGGPEEHWSTAYLTAPQLATLFDTIHATLSHVPYTICGLASLIDHGAGATRRVNRVSVLCPTYAKDNVRAWLATRGHSGSGDSVGIPIPGASGDGPHVCRVRIKYTDDGFDGLERVTSSVSAAWVLGLASQVDIAAAGFVDHLRRLEKLRLREGSVGAGDGGKKAIEATEGETALQIIAEDIFFCLDKAARTRYRFNPRRLPTLLGEEFWVPFTRRYDNARTEMARAGIDVSAVLARHRENEVLREHEAMLREYGVQTDHSQNGGGGVGAGAAPLDGAQTMEQAKTEAASVHSLTGKMSREPTKGSPSGQQQEAAPKPKAENKFLTALLPKRSKRPREDPGKDYGRSLTRGGSSLRPPPRNPSNTSIPKPADGKPHPEWI